MSLTLRPFTPADAPAVAALHSAVDWPVRSAESWRWLAANPARAPDFPIGWLAEDRGRAAFVGEFPQRFWIGEQPVLGVTGYSIIVPPELRGAAGRLIRKIMNRDDAALIYTLNANALSAPLYHRHGLGPYPEASNALKLAWMIDPVVAAGAGIVRRLWPDLSGRSGPERLMNRRLGRNSQLRLPPRVTPLEGFGDDWTLFWSRLKSEDRVLADRSAETMRWRLGEPDGTLSPVLLTYRRDGAITGFLWGQMAKMSRLEPPVLDIIDLVTLKTEPDAASALAGALIANAHRLGGAKVRLQVVSPDMLKALGPLARRARREGGWGHGHARFAPEHAGRLRGGWSPTPFDGDYSFCLRPVPAS
ncbi:MAG: N-acetyltransferase [Brevundimonas sp.]|uniref:N-acetyltransferase n=1 Tax=Brevundimonas sp. TaxID=1871086 RepID=UPI00391CB1A3